MTMIKELKSAALTGRYVDHQADAPLLELQQVSVRYETGTALQDISFQLQAGERVAVVGPNGAGKSTLMQVIAGVLAPSSGTVKIYGHDPSRHVCVAYVPQRSQVDWSFPVTVEDVVMMGQVGRRGLFRWPRQKDWQFVHECLEVVRLDHLAKRQISELSGGQQQRMFIARALAQNAELVLMDEPLTGLDMPSQESIYQILETLQQQQVTVMVSMHDLNQAAERFEKVMLLKKDLLGFGPPEQVFSAEILQQAYGGHLRLIQNGSGLLAVSDTCCGGDHDHGMA